ncbi:MAG: hypothetical protein IPM42_08665 [Saprospiraceae bacterium]|nr:hypothetical protein [Saprospiraceae bacterium]
MMIEIIADIIWLTGTIVHFRNCTKPDFSFLIKINTKDPNLAKPNELVVINDN